MKTLLYALLVCSSMILMGCPLKTPTPIKGDAAVRIPSWLYGQWTKIKDGGEAGTTYEIKADPSDKAKLIVTTVVDGKPDPESVRTAVVSQVGAQLFISVFDKGDEETTAPGYYHYAIGRNSSTGDLQTVPLREYFVSDDVSGEELGAAIAKEKASDEFLEQKDIERYRKQK